MAKFKKKQSGEIASNKYSIFTRYCNLCLLFFFMVATVMRQNTLLIDNNLPFADQVEKLDKKNLVMYIYAGKPSANYKQYGTEARIQLNDKFAEVKDIAAFIAAERADKREELIPFLTTALKIDSDANMGLIGDIKQELRKVNALKINYTTKKGTVIGR